MLCPGCRRQVGRGAAWCGSCGRPLGGHEGPLELVLADATRVPVVQEVTIGRAPGSTVVLADPAVSRTHARIVPGNGEGPRLEDAGSSHGTYVDGVRVTGPTRLRDGARIRIGDSELGVQRRPPDGQPAGGRTIVVPAGASLHVSAVGAPEELAPATPVGMRPRVRSGYALKHLDASEGPKPVVLRDLRGGSFLRLSENDAALLELLDGRHSLVDLIGEAEARFGATGPARLARLLADLGERGLLAGVAGTRAAPEAPTGWRRLVRPREKVFGGIGTLFDRVYRAGGWVLMTRPARVALGVLAAAGICALVWLIARRYGTPFVVADRLGLGGAVFLAGRLLVVTLHELAHGLVMASLGRRVDRAGLKLVLVFPYAFVDTSEAWFEPRARRLAVSAAGPAADLSLGAVFALCCLLLDGTVRDVFFQLAFAAYVGAFFNLNPFLERDGYHMLVDVLREPGLRRRAREQLERRLAGRGRRADDSPVLGRYAVAGLVWSVVAAGFAIALSLRFEPVMTALVGPDWVVHAVLGTLWAALFAPVVWVLARPLWERARG